MTTRGLRAAATLTRLPCDRLRDRSLLNATATAAPGPAERIRGEKQTVPPPIAQGRALAPALLCCTEACAVCATSPARTVCDAASVGPASLPRGAETHRSGGLSVL
mmetsp:Transcript_76147/g.236521  ORF Transcript_76147/g.236521 Transcript_76147/m.236521 type:complete len:106 (-) Transcript_76147:417-734(-)